MFVDKAIAPLLAVTPAVPATEPTVRSDDVLTNVTPLPDAASVPTWFAIADRLTDPVPAVASKFVTAMLPAATSWLTPPPALSTRVEPAPPETDAFNAISPVCVCNVSDFPADTVSGAPACNVIEFVACNTRLAFSALISPLVIVLAPTLSP